MQHHHLFAAVCAAALPATVAMGDLYLNGALSYNAAGVGGANMSGPYEYDSFATPNKSLLLNGLDETPIRLGLGDNVITYAQGFKDAVGLGLFFSSDDVLIEGPFARRPDLAVFMHGDSEAWGVPTGWVATLGQYSGEQLYDGAETYSDGFYSATVTGMTFDAGVGTGTVTITVVPAPAGAGLLAAGSVFALRRRR